MQEIRGEAKTIRQLLSGQRYAIDYYQREYRWEAKQLQELVDDLTGKFLDDHQSTDDRNAVQGYGHYFLGSIILSRKNNESFIIDGQQRLTTLTLLLVYLHNRQLEIEHPEPVAARVRRIELRHERNDDIAKLSATVVLDRQTDSDTRALGGRPLDVHVCVEDADFLQRLDAVAIATESFRVRGDQAGRRNRSRRASHHQDCLHRRLRKHASRQHRSSTQNAGSDYVQ